MRISVRAAGVNPFDYKVYSGTFGTDPEDLPLRPVDAVGPAGPVAVGDEVIAYDAPGAYASEIVVPASSVVPKPAALSWEQAGGLLAAGRRYWVGLVAVQLAVARGATVVATGIGCDAGRVRARAGGSGARDRAGGRARGRRPRGRRRGR
ncbi:hypothetical protein [Streptomyces niveus]|uniref:hypothetical protein n=1 Tax=Streptomyces niveus TaxID=193462 RepID=UPI0034420C07